VAVKLGWLGKLEGREVSWGLTDPGLYRGLLPTKTEGRIDLNRLKAYQFFFKPVSIPSFKKTSLWNRKVGRVFRISF
jgi:hypothetical protein